MLLGADIHVFTDHKNLTFDTLKMQHMLCWQTKIEEFSPMLHYIEGPCNILANNLSRLHCLVTPAQIAEGKKLLEPTEVSNEVILMILSGNVMSVISTYLTPHIRM
jgi:hypothetical protein